MTFSIVARSKDGRAWGVAVASKFLAVGAAVPAARADVGAVATQSFANTLYKREGMELLRGGHSAQETLDTLLAADEQREERQAGIVDARGRAATWTGKGCLDWAGGVTGAGYAIQGNILTGPEVLEAMHEAYLAAESSALPERLLTALRAGDAAGGDSRGRQSAALLVVSDSGGYTPGDDLAYDLRVDDHPDPCPELARLLQLHHIYFDRPDEADLLPLDGELADEVAVHVQRLGYPDLETWAGVENYEVRLIEGQIDAFVLERLRAQADGAS
ncbi:MAG: DUF1028 domain-containing protein [Nocardioidaceae bacterium]|nr:DUF1028 domain-containing protein [Nocardioidaceae bacterium]